MKSTGVVYDERFLQHAPADYHPENPQRLTAIVQRLHEAGLWEDLAPIEPTSATPAELCAVHTQGHLRRIRAATQAGWPGLDADTYVCRASYEVGRLAAGGAIAAVRAVADGRVRNCLALLRPPGHHATSERAMGFCLFNNVAVAARYLLDQRHGQRIMIVDWDVHHGNGTQDIFWNEPNVLYCSIHQQPLYPGTGRLIETGGPQARGATINVALPPGCGDQCYAAAVELVLRPAARRFRPDFVLVSAGFDAHWADPLASMRMSARGFASMMRAVVELADEYASARLALVLEGGYDLGALADSALACTQVLLGLEVTGDRLEAPTTATEPEVRSLLARVRQIHQL
jgi:acetoin utilization deacetylase AcuC-like enzyme